MKDDREKMLAGRWRCPQCNYSVPPKSIKTERKHFTAHSLQCERCKYQTETKPSWDEAISAYRSPSATTPSFNDAIEAAAQRASDILMTAGVSYAVHDACVDAIRALALPAPGGKK